MKVAPLDGQQASGSGGRSSFGIRTAVSSVLPVSDSLFDTAKALSGAETPEYETTTGRPHRLGWVDTVVVRHSCQVSDITGLLFNGLDVALSLNNG